MKWPGCHRSQNADDKRLRSQNEKEKFWKLWQQRKKDHTGRRHSCTQATEKNVVPSYVSTKMWNCAVLKTVQQIVRNWTTAKKPRKLLANNERRLSDPTTQSNTNYHIKRLVEYSTCTRRRKSTRGVAIINVSLFTTRLTTDEPKPSHGGIAYRKRCHQLNVFDGVDCLVIMTVDRYQPWSFQGFPAQELQTAWTRIKMLLMNLQSLSRCLNYCKLNCCDSVTILPLIKRCFEDDHNFLFHGIRKFCLETFNVTRYAIIDNRSVGVSGPDKEYHSTLQFKAKIRDANSFNGHFVLKYNIRFSSFRSWTQRQSAYFFFVIRAEARHQG